MKFTSDVNCTKRNFYDPLHKHIIGAEIGKTAKETLVDISR